MRVVAIATAAAMTLNLVCGPINVLASENPNETVVTTTVDGSVKKTISASVSKFDLYGKDILNAYNEKFKMSNTNIKSIANNGGNYPGTSIGKAIDGDMNTHWETGKPNSATFTNEVVLNFNEKTSLDRIVYAARQSSTKGKGFAQEFEVYSSLTDEGDNFSLVSSGEYKGSTGDIVEIQFTPTEFKRVKFVFKKANQDWASASEFQFYKEDRVSDKMKQLFTDDRFSTVSATFNTMEALNKLDAEAKVHPLYPQFKEDIENAKVIISGANIEATTAVTKLFAHYTNEAYSKLFRMDYKNIASIRNNGGHYASSVLGNAIDENLNTYWETNRSNTSDFTNEVEVEFKEAVELNRIMYGARASDRKGFAEEFEIYASRTTKGDTYELVTTGKHNMVAGLVEAKFKPTTFKRVKFKFKKSNQNWATLSELAFYTEDNLDDKMSRLFTDGTMITIAPEYNSVEKINALEEEAKVHPLYSSYIDQLELAKKVLKGEIATEGRIIEAEQHGNMVKHANDKLKFGFGSNLQPTGLAAQPGDTIIVYVDTVANSPLPSISFSQQEAAWNSWKKSVNLNVGKNVITVPEIPKTSYNKKAVIPGGTIYIENPYTTEQQGKAPTLRFEGVDRVPFATKDTNVEEFKKFLIDYKKKIDEDIAKNPNVIDREVLDVVEVVSDHLFWTGTATGAYKTYIEDGYSPLQTIESYNRLMEELFRYYGLDGRSEAHDPKLIRENIRLAQPYAYMYAAGDHIGTLDDVVSSILVPIEEKGGSWGVIHEIGHRLDIGVRTIGEVTNNMLPQHMSAFYGKIDTRIPFEANIYKNVLKENTKDYNAQGLFEKLAVFWQLEMYSPGYWGKLNGIYREKNVSLTDGESSKQQYLVEFSSEAVGLDLSEHFARHGFVVNEETKAKTSKYPKPDKKIWYLNNSVVDYVGNGVLDKNATVAVGIDSNQSAKTNTLSFKINPAFKDDLLGYEILRDDEVIGFTSKDQFIDKNVDPSKDYIYKVVGYDKKLNTLKPAAVNALSPKLSVEEEITLKLHQEFNPMNYVKANSYDGKDLTDTVIIKSNTVDVSKKGNYEIVYEIKHNGVQEVKTAKVTVTSDYTYISDRTAKSVSVGWGSLQKDKSISGATITLLRQGLNATYSKGIGAHANSEVVYDIEGEGFNFFESYIGIDQAAKGQRSSATFEVWVDGEKRFDSQVFKANTDHEFVRVPVAGAKEVKLITTDAKDSGNSSDHTIWADAKFTLDSSNPTLEIPKSTATKVGEVIDIHAGYSAIDAEDGDVTGSVEVTGADLVNFDRVGKYEITYTVTDSDNNTTTATRTVSVVDMDDFNYLTDFEWQSTQNSYTAPVKNQSTSHNTLRLTGQDGSEKTYQKGIGAHSNSTIIYDLTDKNADYFSSYVGVDRQMHNSIGSVTFQVFVDGEQRYDSGLMLSKDPQKFLEIVISGAKELKLVVTDGGNGDGSDHATWGDTKLHFANADRVFTKNLTMAIEDAKAINFEEYTLESIEILQASITSSEELLANTQATQTEIDRAVEALQQAMASLVAIDFNQIITVTDKNLKKNIEQTLGITGEITLGNMYTLTSLISPNARITSLEGLQYAKNLVSLDISGNEITDLSYLKDLKKLDNVIAHPQNVVVESLTGPKMTVENLVKGLDGKYINPYLIGLRHNKTNKELVLDVELLAPNTDQFTIDLSEEDKGYYTLVIAYKLKDDTIIQLSYLVNNR